MEHLIHFSCLLAGIWERRNKAQGTRNGERLKEYSSKMDCTLNPRRKIKGREKNLKKKKREGNNK